MPSSQDPSTIQTGPGRVHVDVVTAAADLYSTGSSAMVAQLAAVIAQPLAVPTSRTFTAGVGGDATKVLLAAEGPFYVGDDPADDIQDLFKVVSASDDTDIFNSQTQQYVRVTSIAPTAIGSGFGTVSLTLTFSTPVPANLQYRVYYGRRSTVANLPVEMASNPVIRRSPDRVRFPEFSRTGYAPTSISPEQVYTANSYPDPYLASWKARSAGTISLTGLVDEAYSGSTGFVHVGQLRSVEDVADAVPQGVPGAAFLSVYEKDIRTSTFTAGNIPLTRINSTLTGTVTNPGVVTLNAADYFYRETPIPETAIRLGVDMLEITFNNGSKGVFVIVAFDGGSREAQVATLGGASPNFTNGSATFKWIRPTFFTGAAQGEIPIEVSSNPFEFRGSSFLATGSITDSPADEVAQEPLFFAAGTSNPARAGVDNWNMTALAWGAYEDTGLLSELGLKNSRGALLGDGSVMSYGGRIQGLLARRSNPSGYESISLASTTVTWSPQTNSLLGLNFVGAPVNKTVNLELDTAYTPTWGDTFELIVWQSNPSVGTASISWPASFLFSGTDGDISIQSASGIYTSAFYTKFSGTYLGGYWFITRTDYEV